MNNLVYYQQKAQKEKKSSVALMGLGAGVSGGLLVLGTASVLAPPVAIGLAAVSATVSFVGAVNRITQPEFQTLQREKLSEVLSQTPHQEKQQVIELENNFQQATDKLEHNTMLVPLVGLSVALTSSLPIVFPVALATYGIYKAIEFAKNRHDFVQHANEITSLHDKVVAFRNQQSSTEATVDTQNDMKPSRHSPI